MSTTELLKKVTPSGVKLSEQQTNFLTFVAEGKGSAVLEAVAGSGKTFTVMLAIKLIKLLNPNARVLYLVFNKKNQIEAAEKIGADLATVSTFHAAGMRGWSFAQRGKDLKIDVREKRSLMAEELDLPSHLYSFVFSLIDKAMAEGLGAVKPLTTAAMEDVVDHYSLETEITSSDKMDNGELYEAINQGIALAIKGVEIGYRMAVNGLLTFSDLLFAPIKGKCRLLRYDYVFIDEAQDTSAIRRALGKAFLEIGGRLFAVGDRHQAIYGFTGADNDSLDLIAKDFSCQYFPLSVSYRCGSKIIEFAQQWVNHIQAADNAIEGAVTSMSVAEMIAALTPKDAVLCRNTKPLIELAYQLLKSGKACQVLGKNTVGTALIKLATRWKSTDKSGKVVLSLPAYLDRLTAYRDKTIAGLIAKGKEAAADNLNDLVDCILTIAESLPAGAPVTALKDQIERLFVDEEGNLKEVITLSTIHKSKGLEFDNVYWLDRSKYQPSKFARQQWQQDQERNLMYVAATRARALLVDVYS